MKNIIKKVKPTYYTVIATCVDQSQLKSVLVSINFNLLLFLLSILIFILKILAPTNLFTFKNVCFLLKLLKNSLTRSLLVTYTVFRNLN